MNTLHIPVRVRAVAAAASVATTVALFSAVTSLSEPQRSLLLAATASRQMATRTDHHTRVAASKQPRPTQLAQATER